MYYEDTPSPLRLFVDFDGTMTTDDVGDSIFKTFLDPELRKQGFHEAVIAEWKAGRISSEECLTKECTNLRLTKELLDRHLDGHGLTRGVVPTVTYCLGNGIPLTILSDGLDYYIEYLLGKYGLSGVDYRSNHVYLDGEALGIEFPWMDRGCGRCGNCKRWHIAALRRDGETIVYVGDGYSDRYAITDADIVFARGELAGYCQAEGINHRPFETFEPVLAFVKDYHEKMHDTDSAGRNSACCGRR